MLPRGEQPDPCKVVAKHFKWTAENRPSVKRVCKPYLDDEGRQCISCGFLGFRLGEGHHLPMETMPWEVGVIDLTKLFDQAHPANRQSRQLVVPPVEDVLSFIKINKARGVQVPVWDFGQDCPAVNAEYLLDALAVMPEAEMWAWDHAQGYRMAIYMRSKGCEGLLLPVVTGEKSRRAIECREAGFDAKTR